MKTTIAEELRTAKSKRAHYKHLVLYEPDQICFYYYWMGRQEALEKILDSLAIDNRR